MPKWQWALIVAALGFGILAQIPDHDATMNMPGMDAGAAMASPTTVTLAVSGMT